jgi:hypothetical protein
MTHQVTAIAACRSFKLCTFGMQQGSGQYFSDRMGLLYAGQFLIQSAIKPGQTIVIQSHQSQDGGMKVPHVSTIDGCFSSQIIRFAVAGAPPHSTARKPTGKSFGVMITPALIAL